jgi:hypothetical protein
MKIAEKPIFFLRNSNWYSLSGRTLKTLTGAVFRDGPGGGYAFLSVDYLMQLELFT